MAPKKAEKTEAKPGYDATGFTPRNADVLMTYTVSGLDDPKAVAEYLWGIMRKGLDTQIGDIGPVIDGSMVVYTFFTVYRGAEQEGAKQAEILLGIKNGCKEDRARVKMTHIDAPTLPPAIPGIDAPAVLEVVGK